MSIYGSYLTEGLFNKNNKRKELSKIEGIINKYISSINSKFFSDAKLNKKSFSQFTSNKSDSFYLEFRSNIADPKVMKQMFSEFAGEFNKNISKLDQNIKDEFPDFKISLSIKSSNLTLKVTCKEK